MRFLVAIAMMLILDGGPDRVIRFGKSDLNRLPSGWNAAQTGAGKGSVWIVVADESTPSKAGYALMQTAEGPNHVYNLCVLQDGQFKDVELCVQLKAVRGQLDQGGGFVWRYKDANNYYVARMNPLEENYRLYKVIDGKRVQLATKEEVSVKPDTWHELKIRQVGDHAQCWLDGKLILDAKDVSIGEAGRVGLWTKADAQTRFDKFRVHDLTRKD